MHQATAGSLASLGGETMGTRWSARVAARPGADLHALHAGIQQQLDRVVAQMSTWEPGSDISRYRRAPAGTWRELPEEFAAVLDCALEVAAASDGAFDPTVGPLVDLWGFGSAGTPRRVPAAADIARERARCGWRLLQRRDADRALLQPGGVQLDLSAIAKGHGADLAAAHLRARGIAAALVEVGGEIRGYGRKPDGEPWRVLVESAADERAADEHAADEHAGADELPPRVLVLEDAAVATSGDRWHRFDQDRARYAHTIDPRTGTPVADAAASVTVVAGDAMHADAWATALTVMGAAAGLAFARGHGLAARFVVRDGTGLSESMTPEFQAYLAT
ncbi:FAD:protein FMN transferase [Pseudoxanthomonas suwonensis]|uniref:FAD:protein FMN transferase n=1 Tax=Pseudoxanthomonas suwonensis TaxID=314722 RepID=A0A0E3Z296_9GAMM|nr:FAD:protein FMN transferase [Pseudoxanthomonas suwonensis]AKC87632.1 thiamine biosynthesis protein ApbE [Pseudoxanthomonas suwonensis]